MTLANSQSHHILQACCQPILPQHFGLVLGIGPNRDRSWKILCRELDRGQIFHHRQDSNLRLIWLGILELKSVFCCWWCLVIFDFNPKRCGLFGQLRRRGGSKSARWEIAVSGCFNVHPSSTNSTSYESRHLQLKFETSVRSLKLIVWPQDVSEVNEVKMKKIWGKNPKITNFWLTET